MSYFRDLSPCCFFKSQSSASLLNVGWLDARHRYNKGKIDSNQVEKLLRLCKSHAVNRTRGWHRCPFCSAHPVIMTIDEETLCLGSVEIRVAGERPVVFAAPDLICHYIAARQYHPPDEFMAAVATL
jgi:hypothetical protein